MLGDPSVGKTSLIRKYVFDEFSDDYLSTIGAKVTRKELILEYKDVKYRLHMVIWDIAGQKTFTSVSPSLFKGAEGGILICDITRRSTLENLHNWIYNFEQRAGVAPFILLINKWDIMHRKDFEITEVERMARGYNIPFLTTSAKTGLNVEEAFRELGTMILKRMHGELTMPTIPKRAQPYVPKTSL